MVFFITGGNGFLGNRILRELLKSEVTEKIYCLVHKTQPQVADHRVVCVKGDIEKLEQITLNGKVDFCVALAGVTNGRGATAKEVMRVNYGGVLSAIRFCKKNHIKSIALVSSVNVHLDRKGVYAESKILAEKAVLDSGLQYLVFRPALIYGYGCKKGLGVIEEFIRRFGIVPVFGNGKKLEQPVYVDECAAYIAFYLLNGKSGRIIELLGKDAFTYNELCRRLAGIMHKKVRLLHLPVWPFVFGLGLLERLHISFPVSVEQIYHIDSNLSGDMSVVWKETGIYGRTLEENYRKDFSKEKDESYSGLC